MYTDYLDKDINQKHSRISNFFNNISPRLDSSRKLLITKRPALNPLHYENEASFDQNHSSASNIKRISVNNSYIQAMKAL